MHPHAPVSVLQLVRRFKTLTRRFLSDDVTTEEALRVCHRLEEVRIVSLQSAPAEVRVHHAIHPDCTHQCDAVVCVRACVRVWYVLQRYPTVRLNVALDDVPIALREDKMAQQVLP